MRENHRHITRRSLLKGGSALGGLGVLSLLSGCLGSGGGGGTPTVIVGSKRFTEQQLLGYMSVEALDANTDYDVVDEVSLGGTNTNFEAIRSGDIDTYWEYTGTALLTLPPQHDEPVGDPEESYKIVKEDFNREHELTLLNRAPFNNTYVLMANKQWQQETGVETLSDLAEYIEAGNTDFTAVLNAEFQERADGWPGVAEHYGFDDKLGDINVQNVDSGLIYQALGQGDGELGVGFNTNPKIIRFDLVTLEDDERFFPIYNPAPLVRNDTLEAAPAIEDALNAIGPELTTDTIRNLNKRVSIDGENAQTVANEFLSNNGVI